MPGDVAEGLLSIILEFLFFLIFEIFLFYTGEIVLFVLTVGYKKPRWGYYTEEKSSKCIILTELSIWVGFAFWLFVLWAISEHM